MSKFIPLSVPSLKGNELHYVTQAIETEWVSTGGAFVSRFEHDMAAYLHVEATAACQSGTAGLHMALRLAGVSVDDEVIVPTLTFIAAVNPVVYLGAFPVFMDCDDSLNMDLDKLEDFCRACRMTPDGLVNRQTGRTVKAIVAVHIFGNMIDMERLMQIAATYHLKVVEDATEALGTYATSGRYTGCFAGTIGDFGVYSFNGNKIITTGGGGLLTARDPAMVSKAKYLSTQAKDDEVCFIHNEVGYNYRMTNLQAALGIAQLEQLELFIAAKTRNYNLYRSRFSSISGLTMSSFNAHSRPNYWLYAIIVDQDAYGLSRDELMHAFTNSNIQTRPVWGLIHQQLPYHRYEQYRIERAAAYANTVLNIPSSSSLQPEDIDAVMQVIERGAQ